MIKSENIYIRPYKIEDAQESLALQTRNRDFFEKFALERSSNYYTMEAQLDRIRKYEENSKSDVDYKFGIFKNNDHILLGSIELFQVLRGSLQCAFIGYLLDKQHNGRGYTTEAVKLIVKYAFEDLHLHRIEAGVMPHNIGSIRVLEKAGFHKEGIAKQNVKINGIWEDHQVLAIINPRD